MNSECLVNWLMTDKKMSVRSAKDILSRYGRICKMLGIAEFDNNTLSRLSGCEQFKQCSVFIKSQLKRTVALCLEFTKVYYAAI